MEAEVKQKNTVQHEEVPVILSTVTYLEMKTAPSVEPVELGEYVLKRRESIEVGDYLDIYKAVGRDYLWNYRPGQTTSEIEEILHSRDTWVYLLTQGDRTVGLAELDAHNPKDIELVHFGLIPELIEQGLGRKFLQNIIAMVWSTNPDRMWLSTCGLDHPKAVSFYQNAGFSIFKTKSAEFKDWRTTGFYAPTDAPQIPPGSPKKR